MQARPARRDDSPLTWRTWPSHRIIVAGLKKLTPGLPILSEEAANIPYAERKHWASYWLVTRSTAPRNSSSVTGEFTVNIALIENGVPVMGVVNAPALEVCYYPRAGGVFV